MKPPLPRVVVWDRAELQSAPLAEALRPLCSTLLVTSDLSNLLDHLAPEPKTDLVVADLETFLAAGDEAIERLRPTHNRIPLLVATHLKPEDYISPVREKRLYQVLVKTPPFDRHELAVILDSAVDPSHGFGLASHFWHTLEMYSLTATSRRSKNEVVERVINHFATNGFEIHELYDVRLILEELINNAFFHAFFDEKGKEKYHLAHFDSLETGEQVRVDFGNAGGVVGFAVTDNAGTLHPDRILERYERQYKRHGIFDESGRGLYICRMLASSLFFNIHERRRTQVVAVFREKDRRTRLKPLIINFTGAGDEARDPFLHSEAVQELPGRPTSARPAAKPFSLRDLHEDFD
jgi:anti-sigma regulatory factor (Ser/Thr protein kinase)